MSNQLQGMREVEVKVKEVRNLNLFPQVEYTGKKIDAAAFGPATYNTNLGRIETTYLNEMPLKLLSTAESLAVASYNFGDLAKPMIFNPNRLQAGLGLRVSEGVWINPLRDTKREIIKNEKKLNKHLTPKRRVNGIYLLDGFTSFVPYGSFEQGEQEHRKFLEGGLARGLVHTADKRADALSLIANDKEYPRQVNVWGFDSVKEPALRVVSLASDSDIGRYRLLVNGYDWGGDCDGYALGGLVSGEASAQN